MPQPKIGIFWCYNDRILDVACNIDDCAETSQGVDAPNEHSNCWPQIQATNSGLKKIEYFEVPRGRIVFKPKEAKFFVYLSSVLAKPQIKKKIITKFRLPKRKTVFIEDDHYTTEAHKLAQLFE